jgi:eukaryotic-like serine/threonine-protein kinase
MPLSAGDRLGPYEIVAPLGSGGMGEVWKARDTRLLRDVAIKISHENFSERFEREARSIAALNHPNICQLYDIGSNYLVMELIDGGPLKGPLDVDTALRYAKQIAEALEAAHERGIIHRDLKPANIKITADGVAKVLDFGLAKIAESSDSGSCPEDSPTLTISPTRAGMILGTAAYMAPEQARGKPVDARADVWSFGAVLYEMLTGEKAFTGESVSDILASVLKVDPDWSRLPANTPPAIRKLLRRCLTKDRKQRLQAIGEARIVIEEAGEEPSEGKPGATTAHAAKQPKIAWALAALMTVTAAAALWMWLRPKAPEPRGVVQLTAIVPPIDTTAPFRLVVSRDGSRMAFVGGPQSQIYVRRMDQLEARPIPGTEGGVAFLSFSPDGQWISFCRQGIPGKLEKVALTGGAPQVLADIHPIGTAPTQDWGWDDNILYSDNGVLMRVSAAGGKPETLARPDSKKNERYLESAQLLPDGVHILLGIQLQNTPSGKLKSGQIVAFDPKTGEKKLLLEREDGYASYLPFGAGSKVGYIVYFVGSTGSLMAVPFDAGSLTVKGSPVPVLDGVMGSGGFPYLGISESGTLAYVAGASGERPLNTLVWADRKGVEQVLPATLRAYNRPKISPDGKRVALDVATGVRKDIWVYDLARGTSQRITTEGEVPVWTPDGKRLLFINDAGALLSAPADGSGAPFTVASRERQGLVPSSVSPDGKTVMGYGTNSPDLWMLTLPEGSPSAPVNVQPYLADSRSRKAVPMFSPDGHWVAYVSDESGRYEIYVVPFPGPGGRFIISTEGGNRPRWSLDGRELFYQNGKKMIAVDVQVAGSTFHAGKPQVLFEGDYRPYFDVSADGKRFLMMKGVSEGARPPADRVTVVLNWFDELRRRAPANR